MEVEIFKNKKNKTRRELRIEVISVLYKYELLGEKISLEEIKQEFNLNNEQLKTLRRIENSYIFSKNIFNRLLNENWSWNRIDPLIRAILINAASEFKIIQPKIVFNEAIEITKMYYPLEDGEQNKDKKNLVNGILENFYKAILLIENKTKNEQN
ncbi:transcription antitermination factor NusB [Mycoplasma sp. CSL7503-lung]|uniref:transcription antitermination factor NusB n=1 Tax=Mycoplasma sp. CSL7503-lung TaxID=536372 RepID=UPI0021CF7071|nr:transcription antitermination factor NusB [Mycoplasma sp. CSL7503-lung]MCU4706334.1 antitermination protein NusB [Mycoplasma sp. CSL7503-lung]